MPGGYTCNLFNFPAGAGKYGTVWWEAMTKKPHSDASEVWLWTTTCRERCYLAGDLRYYLVTVSLYLPAPLYDDTTTR